MKTTSSFLLLAALFLLAAGSAPADPYPGVWAERASVNAPAARSWPTAVWTGSEMITWGGYGGASLYANDGGRYDPAANAWTALPTTGAPLGRNLHTAVWTGTEMIVWGGTYYSNASFYPRDGGRYNPAANSWTAVTTAGAPFPRINFAAVWTGSEMIVWGGYGGEFADRNLNDGARYNPATDRWTAMTTTGAPCPRNSYTLVWTGSEMIVWGGGGTVPPSYYGDGARYNPTTDTWTAMTSSGAPAGRLNHTAVWTGSEMIVWGGNPGGSPYYNSGGRYNPATDTWRAMSTTGAPAARRVHTAVWTGSEMVVWGGSNASSRFNDGGRYNPATDNWTAMPSPGAPAARISHTAVWTGSEMIISDGYGGSGYLADTWSYYPCAAAVRIRPTGPNSAVLAWPVWSTTLRLCQTTNLSAGDWTTVTNAVTKVGSENQVTLPPLSGRQFFRVEYP